MAQLTEQAGQRRFVSLAGSPNGVSVGTDWRPIHAIHRVKVIQAAGKGRIGLRRHGSEHIAGGRPFKDED